MTYALHLFLNPCLLQDIDICKKKKATNAITMAAIFDYHWASMRSWVGMNN